MKQWLTLIFLTVLVACDEPVAIKVEDQSIRPARIFQVAAEIVTIKHEFVGRVAAAQTVDMSFEVSGPLSELLVREGQFVEADSLIASLDPTDFKLALRKAGVQLKLATQDLERKKKLLRDRGISKSLVDDALAIFELRQVTFEQAAEALADAKLIAPFDGFVAKRFTDNHVNVRSGDPIIRLNDLSELFVYASIPEILFATVSAESIVSLSAKFAFAPEQSFVLEFRESTGEAESVAQTYKVTFAMKRPDGLNILPGMTATVAVELNARANSSPGITIPITALLSNAEREFFVWLYDPATTKVTKRLVKVGAVSGGGVPVVDGLRDGEMIVATGASHLQAGMKVRVLGEPIVGL